MSKAATRWQIINTAAKEIGYVEKGGSDGRSGNITKFWADYYPAWQGSAWCGAFVYWVLQQRGVKDVPLGKTGIFFTPAIVNAARAQGVWRSDSTASLSKIMPGDLVLFDFNGSGNAQHVGFAEKYAGNGNVQTIEGNTSPTNRGSQNNGGGVYRRIRNTGSIMGYVDMDAWLALGGYAKKKPTTVKPAPAKKPAKLVVDGQRGPATYRALQKALGVPQDGIFGPTSKKALQRHLKVKADGIIGRASVTALQRRLKVTPDGDWGPNTTRALQRALNSGTF